MSDDTPGQNPGTDARRSSGNTNDLRGKILRIKPGATGGYTVPAGNMFAPGTARTSAITLATTPLAFFSV